MSPPRATGGHRWRRTTRGPRAAGADGSVTTSVLADLDLSVDGRSARLTGSGQHLLLTSEDPVHLWSVLGQASLPSQVGELNGPRAVGRAAALLSDIGVTLDIVGPRGDLVRLGRDARSVTGRLMTGSESVEPHSLWAVLPFGARMGGQLAGRLTGRLRSSVLGRGPTPGPRRSGPAQPGQGGTGPGSTGHRLRVLGVVVATSALAAAAVIVAVIRRRRR